MTKNPHLFTGTASYYARYRPGYPKAFFDFVRRRFRLGGYEEWNYEYPLSWTLREVICYLYSTSFASRRLFGARLADFEKELKAALLKVEPSGIFRERVQLQALIARKR